MSTAQTLLLGAVAGCTIFIGLPVARLRSVTPSMRAMLAATATGILLFLFWDVLTHAVEPVEAAPTAGHDGRFLWLATLLTVGFGIGLLTLVYYDLWMKARRRKAFLGPAPRRPPSSSTTSPGSRRPAGSPSSSPRESVCTTSPRGLRSVSPRRATRSAWPSSS